MMTTKLQRIFAIFALLLLAASTAFGQARSPLPLVKGTITTQNLASTGDCTPGSCVCVDISTVGSLSVQTLATFTATGGLSGRVSNDWSNWSTLTGASTFTRMSNNTAAATIPSGQVDVHQVSGIVTSARAFCVVATGAVSVPASIIISAAEPSIGNSSSSGGGGGGGAITAASSSYAAGSLSAGAGVDGWDLTQGQKADAVCGTDTGTCSVTSLLKKANTNLTTLAGTNTDLTAVQAPVAPATATATKANLAGLQYNSTPPTFANGQQGSLQGDANGYLKVNVAAGSSSGAVTQGSTTSGQSGMLVQGAVTTSPPSYTNGQTSPLSIDLSGNVRTTSGDIAAPVSGTAAAAGVLSGHPFAVGKGAQAIVVDITSNSATVNFESSADGTAAYRAVRCSLWSSSGSSGQQTSSTATDRWVCPVQGTHFQARQSGAGATAVTTTPVASGILPYQVVNVGNTIATTQSGTWTVQPGNTANTTAWKVAFDQGTPGTSDSVTVKQSAADVAVSVTRPNDTSAYLAGDVIGSSTGSTSALTFSSICPVSGGAVILTSAELRIDATAIISGETSYTLYLYNVTPPSATVDNAGWDLPSGDRASFLGSINLGSPVDLGSTLYVGTDGINKQVRCSGTSLFGYLVTATGYTPTANRVYNVTLHAVGP